MIAERKISLTTTENKVEEISQKVKQKDKQKLGEKMLAKQ